MQCSKQGKPYKPGKPIDADVRRQAIADFSNGLSAKSMTKKIKLTTGTVTQLSCWESCQRRAEFDLPKARKNKS